MLDYFCWGYIQREVTRLKPTCLETLKVAIMRSVNNMPLEMVQRAIAGFPKRVRMCIAAGGGAFKHREYDADLLEFPLLADPAGEPEEEADD